MNSTNFVEIIWLAGQILLWVGTLPVTLVFVGAFLYYVSKKNVLGTFLEEKTAANVEQFGKFAKPLMTNSGWKHRGNTELTESELKPEDASKIRRKSSEGVWETDQELKDRIDPHSSDIVPDTGKVSFWSKFCGGWHLLGIPLIHKLREEGGVSVILLTDVTRVITVKSANAKDLFPLIFQMEYIGSVVNQERWAYAGENPEEIMDDLLSSGQREFAGLVDFMDLLKIKGCEMKNSKLSDIVDDIRRRYGFKIEKVLVKDVSPDGKDAELFASVSIETATAAIKNTAMMTSLDGEILRRTKEADSLAQARGIAGTGEKNFLEQTLAPYKDLNPQILEMLRIRDSKITVFVDKGNGGITTIPLPT